MKRIFPLITLLSLVSCANIEGEKEAPQRQNWPDYTVFYFCDGIVNDSNYGDLYGDVP